MPPITCHILDTTLGRPAQNVKCEISVLKESFELFATAFTNSDGRVAEWLPDSSNKQLVASLGFKDNSWSILSPGVSVSRSPPSRSWSSPATKLLSSSSLRSTFKDKEDMERCSNELSLSLWLFTSTAFFLGLLSFRRSLPNIFLNPRFSSSSSSLKVIDEAGVPWSTEGEADADETLEPVSWNWILWTELTVGTGVVCVGGTTGGTIICLFLMLGMEWCLPDFGLGCERGLKTSPLGK
ncbi:hypothetical protein OGAPHI_005312 [Ogataea philodendri]|uniref:Transthyretin/hydroxyisourate hydrolase domain-containing protein n=1 Tax=Ogataea philodendri TaxID=1378263 RepID=A0A9P8P195_9ASCO|nr:uncharacterized protein OGAPHI_005312 [Ogataea philodendri]KAH3663322.1 hypothetical protein OGAPHI_005312 [Ogataea philodendri]